MYAVRLGCAVYAGIGLSAATISLCAKQRKDTITEDYSYQCGSVSHLSILLALASGLTLKLDR